MARFHTVCQASDLSAGDAKMCVVDEVMVGIFNVKGKLFALDNRCPHEGASLAHGLIEGDTVACRIHHWRFRICDGTYLDEDKPGCNARTIPLRVIGDDVQVEI